MAGHDGSFEHILAAFDPDLAVIELSPGNVRFWGKPDIRKVSLKEAFGGKADICLPRLGEAFSVDVALQ